MYHVITWTNYVNVVTFAAFQPAIQHHRHVFFFHPSGDPRIQPCASAAFVNTQWTKRSGADALAWSEQGYEKGVQKWARQLGLGA